MPEIFYIADTHFDHANILKMSNRPFSGIEEMNEALVENWNRKVKGNDTVYIVGDLFFRTTDPERILKRLKGKKFLIEGNHDATWMGKVDLQQYFLGTAKLLEISDGTRGITLCHYPLMTWKHQRKTYMIHGHVHNDTSMDYWPLLLARERVLNAGADINRFEPVRFEELLANNLEFKAHWREYEIESNRVH